ncbi:MAG: hypothetical protein EB168_09330 [Euryarchaeota archaeon]|nr:hypothetical protein [Euryarchaeota archaeon]
MLLKRIEDWQAVAPGLDLQLSTEDSSDFSTSMSQLPGKTMELNFSGRGTLLDVNFLQDPTYTVVDALISDDGVKPVNTSVIAKNFVTCLVNELRIRYRRKAGQFLDEAKAREDIVRYVNSLTYPEVYEEHVIAEIVLYRGAHGVQKVLQDGVIYPSLAHVYHTRDGEVTVEQVNTDTLLPDSSVAGLGPRNINYILDSSRIKFDAITI